MSLAPPGAEKYPVSDETMIDALVRASRQESAAVKPWREEVDAAAGKLMRALGIAADDYQNNIEQVMLSLKEKFSFKNKADCERAITAVKEFMRITRTEYFEQWDEKGKTLLSPFKHAFVAVADNKAQPRTTESAYRAMVEALEEATGRTTGKMPSPI